MKSSVWRLNGVAAVPLPKVASSSIVQTLVKGGAEQARKPEEGDFVFAFVRCPFSRVSAVWRCLVADPPGGDLPLLPVAKGTTFEAFVDQLPGLLGNAHLTPQSRLLSGIDLDFVGRFERLSEDWMKLAEAFDLPPLKHLNRYQGSEEGVYGMRTCALVEALYAADIEMWDRARPTMSVEREATNG